MSYRSFLYWVQFDFFRFNAKQKWHPLNAIHIILLILWYICSNRMDKILSNIRYLMYTIEIKWKNEIKMTENLHSMLYRWVLNLINNDNQKQIEGNQNFCRIQFFNTVVYKKRLTFCPTTTHPSFCLTHLFWGKVLLTLSHVNPSQHCCELKH